MLDGFFASGLALDVSHDVLPQDVCGGAGGVSSMGEVDEVLWGRGRRRRHGPHGSALGRPRLLANEPHDGGDGVVAPEPRGDGAVVAVGDVPAPVGRL